MISIQKTNYNIFMAAVQIRNRWNPMRHFRFSTCPNTPEHSRVKLSGREDDDVDNYINAVRGTLQDGRKYWFSFMCSSLLCLAPAYCACESRDLGFESTGQDRKKNARGKRAITRNFLISLSTVNGRKMEIIIIGYRKYNSSFSFPFCVDLKV